MSKVTHHQDPDPTPRSQVEQLVTIESQAEFDLLSGQRSERLFLKMYVAARTSGLLAAISDRDWKTLCTLATYMDADGYCFPSQAELAKALGCSRQMANERIKSLAQFRFQGKPVLLVVDGQRTERGRWARNGYRVMPIANLGIFDEQKQEKQRRKKSAQATTPTVSRSLDTVQTEPTVSNPTGTVALDTNKNQSLLNKNNTSNTRKASPKKKETDEVEQGRSQPLAAQPAVSYEEFAQQPQRQEHREDTPPQPGSPPKQSPPAPPRGLNRQYLSQARAKATSQHLSRHSSGMTALASMLSTPPHQLKRPYTEERQVLVDVLSDIAREFRDEAELTPSVSRAYNLMQDAKIQDIGVFTSKIYEARSITKERYGTIKRRMPYFFSVLSDVCGLKPKTTMQTPPSG